MTPMAKTGPSRAAVYAQERRDNEVEAREELNKRLPKDAFLSAISLRGDFNITTKTLLATLRFLDPSYQVPDLVPRNGPDTLEYNQLRRNNEASIRDKLKALVPENFFTTEITSRSDFNPTTKVMIAASLHVKEVLEEAESTESPSTNSTKTLDNLDAGEVNLVHSQQYVAVGQHGTVFKPHSDALLTQQQDQYSALPTKKPHNQTFAQLQSIRPVMPPITRSTALNANAASCEQSQGKGKYDDIDLLASLREDERKQELNLDLKPPPLPQKLIKNQGLWEIRLKDPKTAPHPNEDVRALEQVTKRLVAKAKEVVLTDEGGTTFKKPLNEAHDMCVDTIAMLEGHIEKKKYRKKWMAIRADWSKEYGYELDD